MALSRIFADEINAAKASAPATQTQQYYLNKYDLGQTGGTNNVGSSTTTQPIMATASRPGVNYTAGGGGGGGGYGGGDSAPLQNVGMPVPAPAPVTYADDTSYFDLDEIRAALEAISARYELERGGLQGQENTLGRALELLMGRLGKEQGRSLFDNKARNSGSGRIRSGLFLQDQARIADTYADQEARARAENTAQLSPIQQALGTLNARRDAERANEARNIARQQRSTQAEIARALELV